LSQPSCAQASVCSANIGNGLCTESGLGGLETATFIDGWVGRRRGDAEFMRSREIQRKILNKFGISAPISYTSEIPSAQNIYKTRTTPTVFPSNEIAGHADTRRGTARSLRNTNEYSSTPAGPRAGLYTVYAGRFVQSLIYVGLIYPM